MSNQPFARSEQLPALPNPAGPIAERSGHDGSNGWTGYPGSANGRTALPPGSAQASAAAPSQESPTYFQLLLHQVRNRWKLLLVWLLLTGGVAAAAVKTLGKPMYRAEGRLYYMPDYGYSHSRIYTPPNIQSVLTMIKSPDVIEKLRKEKTLDVSTDALLTKMTASVVKNSEYIAVGLDWADRSHVEELANRLMELAIEKYDDVRQKLTKKALEELDENLKKAIRDELELKRQLNEILAKRGIFDLHRAQSNLQGEISAYESERNKALDDEVAGKSKIKQLEETLNRNEADTKGIEGPPSVEEVNLLNQLREIKEKQIKRKQEMEVAKIQLKGKNLERESSKKLYDKGYMSAFEWNTLLTKIDELKVLANGTEPLQKLEKELKEIENKISMVRQRSAKIPVQQARFDLMSAEIANKAIPEKIRHLEERIKEKSERLKQLAEVEKELLPMDTEIKSLEQRRVNLTTKKQEHEKLQSDSSELTISSKAKLDEAPVSSNHAKLAFAVFALSLLMFMGLVAVLDMPKALADVRASQPHMQPAPAHSNLPVPIWNGPTALAPRGPSVEETNEHLRALAARIAQNASDAGSIVLFTPASKGLRVDSLVADLGCYYAQHGGRVLVFDTRSLEGSFSVPAWAGPGAGDVGAEVEDFLLGHIDRPGACFVSTLINSIDYSRGDIFSLLKGILSHHRFRRLVGEMKNAYSLVLMITPEMYHRNVEDDFLGQLAEGVVLVMNDGVNPAEIDAYIQNLRAREMPVYGAVTVPGRY